MPILLRVFFVFFLCTIPSVCVHAEVLAVNQYISAKLGYSGMFVDPIKITNTTTHTKTSAHTLLSGVNIDIAIGTYYAFSYVALRTELDYSVRFTATNNTNTLSSFATGISQNTPCTVSATLHSLLLNVYLDFNTKTRLVPYIGAGIGASAVTDKYKFNGMSTGNKLTFNFSWMASIGAAIYIIPNVAVDIQARYFDLGNTKHSIQMLKFKNVYQAVEALIGIRYTF